jgi:tetratricopeptide (TPR) repeat protein
MAEENRLAGLTEGEDGGESTGPEVTPVLDTAAEAMAMNLAAGNAHLAAKAATYFDRHARLIEIQTEHLHEQRAVQIALARLKRFSDRLRIGIQLFFIGVAAVVGAYVLLLLHDAITARAVIVEPFDAPPKLAERGLTGRVVASALLDQLTRLQAASQSTATRRDLANSWTGDIKLELPETGVSFGELDRLLKSRLGHETHIGGDLVQAEAGGLELTVRGDGVTPQTFSGAAADLHALTVQAADYVYGQTQPALYAVYLLRAGRNDDAIAFGRQAILTAPRQDRPYILNAWADALSNEGGDTRESLALEHAALALKPDYWTAYGNAIQYQSALGDQEGAWRLGRAMLEAAGGRPGSAPEMAYVGYDWLTGNVLAERAAVLADAEQHAGIGATTQSANPTIAGLDVDLHDFEGARFRLQSFDMKDPYAQALAHWVRGRMETAAGDSAAAWRDMQAWGAANASPAISQGDPSYHCIIAPAAEAVGLHERADAELRAGGRFVDCYRFRADILDQRGDWPAAQRAYAEAVVIAPDLPFAYYSWGQALARHGDLAGATHALQQAHARGPRWADPLKALGDLAAQQQHWGQAMDRYDAALKLAPAWPELKAARNAALAKLR